VARASYQFAQDWKRMGQIILPRTSMAEAAVVAVALAIRISVISGVEQGEV
jgi:hypothetical protein